MIKLFLKIISKIKTVLLSYLIYPFITKDDLKIFFSEYKKEKNNYVNKKYSIPDNYILPEWAKNCSILESFFLNNFTPDFLRHPVVGGTMFIVNNKKWRDIQIDLLNKSFPISNLKYILKENSLGNPILTSFKYKTSSNSIHHLYHFAKFQQEANFKLENLKTIVEFGGGYGNASKIFKRIFPDATYIIIDLPLFSSIQTIYLKTILGQNVNVLSPDNIDIKKGKINILPLTKDTVGNLKNIPLSVDLFLSTWALSESPLLVQQLISSVGYFGAKYLLMAYQENNSGFVAADNVKNINKNYKIMYNKETEYLNNNFYLFCEKIN